MENAVTIHWIFGNVSKFSTFTDIEISNLDLKMY